MKRSDAMPKFVGTTAINMPGSIAKDQALTKIFGVVGGAAKVPAASFALFTVRDVATMAAAFTLPSPMSAKVWERVHILCWKKETTIRKRDGNADTIRYDIYRCTAKYSRIFRYEVGKMKIMCKTR